MRVAALFFAFAAATAAQTTTVATTIGVSARHRSGALAAPRSAVAGFTAGAADWIDTNNREAVKKSYLLDIADTRDVPTGWTGTYSPCNPGTVSQAYLAAVTRRINWFRSMAGAPKFVNTVNAQVGMQDAALRIRMDPSCPSQAADNVFKTPYQHFNDYARDTGAVETSMRSGDGPVSRIWMTYMGAAEVGIGSVGSGTSSITTVRQGTTVQSQIPPRDGYVAWPPPGWVPYQAVYPLWSLTLSDTYDVSGAGLNVTRNGSPIAVTMVGNYLVTSEGRHLHWTVDDLTREAFYPKPSGPETIVVSLTNVRVNNQPTNITYTVNIFDPYDTLFPPHSAAYLDTYSSMRLMRQGISGALNAGGVFTGKPAVSLAGEPYLNRYQSPSSTESATEYNHVVVGRDTGGGYWINSFRTVLGDWTGWQNLGGVFSSDPSITSLLDGRVLIAGRDLWGGYWIQTWSRKDKSGWIPLGGVLASDPAVRFYVDRAIIAGRDQWGGVWTRRWNVDGSFGAWRFGGGIVKGNLSVTNDSNKNFLIATRDNSDGAWVGQLNSDDTWGGWTFHGAVLSADPNVVRNVDDTIYLQIRDPWGGTWLRQRPPGTATWNSWAFLGGVVTESMIGYQGRYIVARDGTKQPWWFDVTTKLWQKAAGADPAGGPVAASDRY